MKFSFIELRLGTPTDCLLGIATRHTIYPVIRYYEIAIGVLFFTIVIVFEN
jgi:hypothetical protein